MISTIKNNPKLDEKAIKITEALVEGKKIQKAVESKENVKKVSRMKDMKLKLEKPKSKDDLKFATTDDERDRINAERKKIKNLLGYKSRVTIKGSG